MMRSVNPATGEVVAEYQGDTREACLEKLEKSRAAWLEWRTVPVSERAGPMAALAQVLKDRADEFAGLITTEMGKLLREAKAEVLKCAGVCEHYAAHAGDMLRERVVQTEASRSYVRFEPLGPILAIMPWNFPFWQAFRFAAPGLMAGNACLLKHASNVTGCSLAIQESFRQAGFPEGIFQSLLISGPEAQALIGHEIIRGVTLTGSENAGRAVAAEAGRHIKKSVLELGGSDPFIVLDDADLDACCPLACTARVMVTGQVCIAAKRFIVAESLAEEFTRRLKVLFENLVPGDPMLPETTLAPMARPDLVEALDRQIRQSLDKGARLVTGGGPLDRPGFRFAPTILTDVVPGMPAYDEETFGPVAVILPVKNDQEALAVANDTSFGLGGSVWSRDVKRAEALARGLEAGAVTVNALVSSHPKLPFGGSKNSGYGRELAAWGIQEFTNIKSVWIG